MKNTDKYLVKRIKAIYELIRQHHNNIHSERFKDKPDKEYIYQERVKINTLEYELMEIFNGILGEPEFTY